MSDNQTKKCLAKIYKILKDSEKEFCIRWLPNGDFGNTDGEVVVVNVFDMIVQTTIHECLHEIYPEMDWFY